MSAMDETLFETMLRVENKDIFVDLKKNKGGVYLKISERNGGGRNTVLIPASGIPRLKAVLEEVTKESTKVKSVSRERKSRIAGDPDIVSRSVYVSGLTWDTTEDELWQHFAQAGSVVRAVILRQRRGGTERSSMGCGIVEFAREDLAVNAVNLMNETELKGRRIFCREDRLPVNDDGDETSASALEASVVAANSVNIAAGAAAGGSSAGGSNRQQKAPRRAASNGATAGVVLASTPASAPASGPEIRGAADPGKLFVSGLTWETTGEELSQLFGTLGTVESTEILTTRKGRSMGSGIVTYVDAGVITRAVAQFNGVDFNGRKIGVRQYYQNA